MRKQIIVQPVSENVAEFPAPLDLVRLVAVELTSEDPRYPIENALVPGSPESGWRAAEPGPQTIRLLFDEPQQIQNIRLLFQEAEQARTQQFTLRWLPRGSNSYREIIRQQYTFSPPGTIYETESYTVDLADATAVELSIVPDISGGSALASLREVRLAA